MTNKLKPVKDGGSIVSIVLEIQRREENEISLHFIHKIKTKGYDLIVFAVVGYVVLQSN